MNRKLFRQTANEWRTNLWLALELLIVSVVVWYIVDYIYVIAATRMMPTGFNTENVYKLQYRTVPSNSPHYVQPDGDDEEARATDLRRIVNAIRLRPDVEAVSLSYQGEPYSQSYYGTTLKNNQDTLELNVYRRQVTPNHLIVVGYQPAEEGVTIESLVEKMENGESLLTDFYPGFKASNNGGANVKGTTAGQLVGRKFHGYGDSIDNVTIGGVLAPVKRTNIEPGVPVSWFLPLDESTTEILKARTINVKIRPEAARTFLDDFNADRERLYRSGNTYISKIESYDSVRRAADHNDMVNLRKYVACMVFMLVSVFLGLLGTFWFRTQQRVSEIAIRKVNGASKGSVFCRLIGEGMLLLVLVTPVAALLDWVLCHYEFNTVFGAYGYFSPGRFILSVLITFGLMSLMIIGGIWFPASRAMKIDPARALADE